MVRTQDNGHGQDDSRESLVAEAVDEFRERWARGEQPDAEEYAARFPPVASELRMLLPALAALDTAGPDTEIETRSAIGDFRIQREIGRGGMAVVYEAEQLSLARTVALKVLPFAAVMDPRQLQRFKNEAQAAAHLHHSHIVPVHSVGCERGVHYYAMQHIEGLSIAQMIDELRSLDGGATREGSSSAALEAVTKGQSTRSRTYCRAVARLGVQAAEALDHAHQHGVVHRDIKPGNLLVDATGHLWITDFGLASFTSQPGLTITGDIVGTVRYMSPEQALAKRVPIDHRTDVYSLGVTLYELLTLNTAFPGDDPHTVIQDIAFKEPPPARSLNDAAPAELETILLKAMAKDPADRYATAQELADDLARYLRNEPIHARRPTPVQRIGRWTRRHTGLVAGLAAILVLAVAGLATGATLLWQEQARTEQQHRRAEANLALALDALDQVYLDEAEITPTLRRGLSRDLLERGLGFYKRFAEKNADNATARLETGRALGRAGLIYRKLGQPEEAAGAFDAAVVLLGGLIRERPDDALAHYRLGFVLCKMERIDEGIAAYREAIRFDPDDSSAHLNLGAELCNVNRDFDGAIAAFREAIRLDPNDPMAHQNLGATLALSKGLHDEGIRELREAIRLGPQVGLAHQNLGRALIEKGLVDEGIDALREATRRDPYLASAHIVLGDALRDRGARDEAIGAYREAIRVDPENASAHFNLGNALRQKGQIDDAIAEFREAIRVDPERVAAHCNLGNALARKGFYDEAIAAIREAIRLEPNDATVHANLGVVLCNKGLVDEAIAECREAIRIDPNCAEGHVKLGFALHEKGLPEEAIAAYREAIRVDPDHAEAHSNLGASLTRRGLLDEGIAACRKAVRLAPDAVEARMNLGFAFQSKGLHDEAIVAYWEAVRLAPDAAEARVNLGFAFKSKGLHDEAIAAYREAIRLDPDHARAYVNLGAVLCNVKRDFDGAIAAFREAIRLEPGVAIAHCNLGNALLNKGQVDEAIAAYREAIRLEPDDSRGHFALGTALRQKDQIDGAIAAWQQVICLDPSYPRAHYELATALCGKGLFDEAIAAYRNAIRVDPNTASAHLSLGAVLCDRKRDFDGAIAAFREAIRLTPDNSRAHFNLGIAFRKNGQIDDAIDAWRQAIRLDPDHVGAHSNLGVALCDKKRDFRGAIVAFREVIRLTPQDSTAQFNLGLALFKNHQLDDAIAAWREAARLAPGNFRAREMLSVALFNKGRVLAKKDEYEEAIASLREAARLASRPEAYNLLALILATCPDERLRDPEEAVRWAKKAASGNPNDGNLFNTLGVALYHAGQFAKALKVLERSMQLRDGGDARDWLFVAMAKWHLGGQDQARAFREKALAWIKEHAPDDPELKRFAAEAAELMGEKTD